MEIRKLNEKDIPSLNKLQTKLGHKKVEEIPGCLYGAFENGELLGIVGVFPYKRLPHKDYPTGYLAEIGALYVKEPFRGRGVATKLLEFAMKDTDSLHLDAYVIDCTDSSFEIFSRIGFEESKEHRMWKQNRAGGKSL